MKTWLFALLQALIAALGLVAYFWGGNVLLASVAAIAAATLGISQPLISAHKARKLQAFQEEQFADSLSSVNQQIQPLLDDSIDTPLPHHDTLLLVIQRDYPSSKERLLAHYSEFVEVLSAQEDAVSLARSMAADLEDDAVGIYLLGLALLRNGEHAAARDQFSAATKSRPDWILPWLGWADASFHERSWDELRKNHPHINGVEVQPYGVGDEKTFLQLDRESRDELVQQFQAAARSLGNYYTIAEMENSKSEMELAHEAWKDAA